MKYISFVTVLIGSLFVIQGMRIDLVQSQILAVHERVLDMEKKSAVARVQLDTLSDLHNAEKAKSRKIGMEAAVKLCVECHGGIKLNGSISPDMLGKLLD